MGVVDLLEDRELLHTSLELIHERMLVNTVLIEALQTVQFHNIVMSEELLELFVLMSEHAHASKLTVFTIVEGSALGCSSIVVLLLLDP